MAAVCDRDAVIAVAGGGKRELLEKRVSPELEQLMESRRPYRHDPSSPALPIVSGEGPYSVAVAAPVVSEGDLMGCVIFAGGKNSPAPGEVEYKLAETVARLPREADGGMKNPPVRSERADFRFYQAITPLAVMVSSSVPP